MFRPHHRRLFFLDVINSGVRSAVNYAGDRNSVINFGIWNAVNSSVRILTLYVVLSTRSNQQRTAPFHGVQLITTQISPIVTFRQSLMRTRTPGNPKCVFRQLQADTLPHIERLKQKEHRLQGDKSTSIPVMLESPEGKDCRLPIVKVKVELADKVDCYHQTCL